MNRKGFTVIELVISFAFVSALTASLFTLVLNYRDKEQAAADIVEITNFKNVISTLVQRDIETKILQKAEYCNDAGTYVNRCINLVFRDGTSKQLSIVYSEEKVTVASSELTYYKYYIIYDDVLYAVPAQGNVEVRADYMLNYTNRDDAIEKNIGLYRINLSFYHKNLDVDAELNIVATGEGYQKTGTGSYKNYNVGRKVRVQINSACQKNPVTGAFECSTGSEAYENFFVLQDSDSFDRKVTLLYDGEIGKSVMYRDSRLIKTSNTFADTAVYDLLTVKYNEWTSIEQRSDIRLLTANEISLLAGHGLSARLYDASSPIVLGSMDATTNSFLTSPNDYWTSSNYLTPGLQEYMWVYKDNQLVKAKMYGEEHYIRPVVRVDKMYVLDRD